MKKIYSFIIVLAMTVCLAACNKDEQIKETSGSTADVEFTSQNAEPMETEASQPMETEASQKQSEDRGDLPFIEIEEPATAKPDKKKQVDAPTETSTEGSVVNPIEEQTNAPAEEPTKEQDSSQPEDSTDKPVELPFVPAS